MVVQGQLVEAAVSFSDFLACEELIHLLDISPTYIYVPYCDQCMLCADGGACGQRGC